MKSGFHFSPDGGASEGGIFKKLSVCEACNCRMHEDDLTLYVNSNMLLCPDCLADYKSQDEEVALENKFLEAIKERPMDELLSMQWVFDTFYAHYDLGALSSRTEKHTNIAFWENLVKIAIDSKKNKV